MKTHILKLALCAAILSGCPLPMETYTALTTRNIDPHTPISKGRVVKNVEGYDWRSLWFGSLIWFAPVEEGTRVAAVNDALKKADADILINVKVYRRWWWIPYIYGQETVRIEADAIVFDKK